MEGAGDRQKSQGGNDRQRGKSLSLILPFKMKSSGFFCKDICQFY